MSIALDIGFLGSYHALLPKIHWSGDATKVDDAYT